MASGLVHARRTSRPETPLSRSPKYRGSPRAAKGDRSLTSREALGWLPSAQNELGRAEGGRSWARLAVWRVSGAGKPDQPGASPGFRAPFAPSPTRLDPCHPSLPCAARRRKPSRRWKPRAVCPRSSTSSACSCDSRGSVCTSSHLRTPPEHGSRPLVCCYSPWVGLDVLQGSSTQGGAVKSCPAAACRFVLVQGGLEEG
jgi:hypothetical protein